MEERKLHPVSFDSITDPAPWGSERWLVADLGYRDSVARGGWLDGNSIGDIMEAYLDRVTGDGVYNWYGRQFPLLVREIRSNGGFPLLACPDDVTAYERYDCLGKTKLWYVLKTGPDAVIYHGLKRKLPATEFYNGCMDGSIMGEVEAHRAVPGSFVLISPGEIHSIGGEATVLEIAESSAMDLRLYNWGRVDTKGEPDIDLVDAFDMVRLSAGTAEHISSAPSSGPGQIVRLAECEQFSVSRVDLREALRISSEGVDGCPVLYTCVSGALSVQVHADDGKVDYINVGSGSTVLIPAEVTDFYLVPRLADTVLLESIAKARMADDGNVPPYEGPEPD